MRGMILIFAVAGMLVSCDPVPDRNNIPKKWYSTKFVPSDGAALDRYGCSVSLSSGADKFIVGAYGKNSSTGAVYYYALNGGTWNETKFVAYDAAASDYFGSSVAIGGGVMAVGAPYDDDKGANSGSVYQIKWSGLGWGGAKLVLGDGLADQLFGESVSISTNGAMIAVGSGTYSVVYPCEGAVYLMTQSGLSWSTNMFTPPDAGAGMWFGSSVALSADGTAFIAGAVGPNDYTGAAYLYKKSGASWVSNKFVPTGIPTNYLFGNTVAISGNGDVIAVGAENRSNMVIKYGALYIYRKSGSSWLTNQFTNPDIVFLGYSVAVSLDGNTVAAGAVRDDTPFPSTTGAVYLYKWNGVSWIVTKINAPDAVADDFGSSVSLSADGNTLLVGAVASDEKGTDSGSVYLYQYK